MDHLKIEVTPEKVMYDFGGDLTRVARALAKVGLVNEEFAIALNLAVTGMNEELKAERLRDEMIGFINPQK